MPQDLETRIAKLEAEAEIRRLKARYLNACDSKDVATFRSCFTPDAEINLAPLPPFTLEELVRSFEEQTVNTSIIVTHHGYNAEITVLDQDRAEARWQIGFSAYDPDTGVFRMISNFAEDTYVRTDQGWKIAATKAIPRNMIDGKLASGQVTANQIALSGEDEGLSLMPED